MGEPIKDLGTLIDELIAVRIKQALIIERVHSAYPAPELKSLNDEAITIRMKISAGQFKPCG